MIRIAPFGKLRGVDAPGLRIRDHFRGSPENAQTPVFGLGPMRVLADTQIAPQTGFPMHGHRDFEIVTYVCEGMIAHEDTTGAKGILRMGDVQAMTTGSGVMHSESNPGDDPTRVYQMWFHAEKGGLTPDYTDLVAPPAAPPGDFTVYASGAAHIDGLIRIHQDVAVMGASLQRGESILRDLAPGRLAMSLRWTARWLSTIPGFRSVAAQKSATKALSGLPHPKRRRGCFSSTSQRLIPPRWFEIPAPSAPS
jgi:quercetin 2,3-dioxygenase